MAVRWLTICFLVLTGSVLAQKKEDYTKADALALHTDDTVLHTLTQKLTQPFRTEQEKVRAIFRWITAHIDYDVAEYRHVTNDYAALNPIFYQTADRRQTDSLYNIAVAKMVLRKRKGICDGYSRLFKAMCNDAGIAAIQVSGHGRTTNERIVGMEFAENHAWNAVRINKQWYLLDAAWASGYTNDAIIFTRSFSEDYYLAPPQRFALNHYPKDTAWLFCNPAPDRNFFESSPCRLPDLWDSKIQSYNPQTGVIRYGGKRTILFDLTADATVNEAAATAYRSDHAIHFSIEAGHPSAAQTSMAKHKQSRLPEPASKAEQAAIASIIDYVNSVPADHPAKAAPNVPAANIPACRIDGHTVSFHYTLPEGLYKELLIFYNGRMILRYELIF